MRAEAKAQAYRELGAFVAEMEGTGGGTPMHGVADMHAAARPEDVLEHAHGAGRSHAQSRSDSDSDSAVQVLGSSL